MEDVPTGGVREGQDLSGSDTESINGVSDAEGEDIREPVAPTEPIGVDFRGRPPVRAFASLDSVNLVEVFNRRAHVMRAVPLVFRGAFHSALKLAMQEIVDGARSEDLVRCTRAWKLFFLLPRMLLFRPVRRGLVPRTKLEERFRQFQSGDWTSLLLETAAVSAEAHSRSVRRRRRDTNDNEAKRVARAMARVQLGELSAARQALGGAEVAPGTLATLAELTNPERRPQVPRQPINEDIMRMVPGEQFQLDPDEFLIGLRKTRRGAAAGPSGMTSDHLFPILESEADSDLLVQVGALLSIGNVPESILNAIRLGRITALCKPDGGVRGIVVGDILRRLVAKTMAKQVSKEAETATAPFQYALSTKAGCECVAHMLQSITDLDPEATVISIDGIGACDLISRNAMLEGLLRMEKGDQILPFVRCFFGIPSTYLWDDEMGVTQHIHQGEGGEQGDPLMPMLFTLGQHPALAAAQERLRGNELLFAYLDDYAVC